jgi:UDP-N-acetylglucosamine acyltransferase
MIHPTAVISPGAEVADDATVGPYCIVGGGARIGARARLDSHCVVEGHTTVGEDTHVFPFVSIGLAPQDLKYGGEPAETRVGRRCQVREFVTIHRGTQHGGMLTSVGDDCLIMAQAHVAHDCLIGNKVIMANAATLAGHVEVADGANIGAYSGVHQFCRVGREAYVGGYSVVVKDAMPFALTVGNHAKCYGLNAVGMRRRGYPRETTEALHRAFRLLLSAKLNTTQALQRIREEVASGAAEVEELVRFIETSRRGVVK